MKIYFKNIFILILLLVLNLSTFSQKSLMKKIINLRSESYIYTHNTSDGGWITATSRKYFDAHQEKSGLIVIKYNKCSQIEWSKQYNFDNDYFTFSDICIENNGNMMICGYSCFYDSCNPVVISLSSNGNLIWYKKLSSSLAKYVYSIGKTTDNNYFIFGMIADINGAMPCNFIVKFNSAATVLWSYKYYDNPVWGEAVAVESNHILVRSGNLIYKVNGNGQVVWAQRFIGLHYSSKPLITSNSYIYTNYPSSPNDTSCHILNLNTSGFLTFTGTGFNGKNLSKAKKLNNGNLIFTGTYKDNSGDSFVSLIEATQNGGILSQKIINNSNAGTIDRGCDIVILADNSLVITAKNNQSGEIFLIKTDQNQEVLCGETNINSIFTVPDLNIITEFNYQFPINEGFTSANLDIVNVNLIDTSLCFIPDTMNLDLGNDTILCAGSELKLKSNITGNYTYLWSTGETSSEITVLSAGTYWLKVIGCDMVTDSIKINYTKGLSIDYTIYPLKVDLGEHISFSNNTTNYQNYFWETGDGTIYLQNHFEHIYENHGYFYPVIHLTDSFNCHYTDTTKVEVRFATIYIPNSFTPNGDGINEFFEIKGESIKTYTLYIYNRWGQLIYTTQNHGWDGTNLGNPCQNGVYNYKAEIKDIFGRYTERKGNIVLIR